MGKQFVSIQTNAYLIAKRMSYVLRTTSVKKLPNAKKTKTVTSERTAKKRVLEEIFVKWPK